MISFLGEYESTVDAKGRFLLPASLKKQLGDTAGNLFVINRGFEKCLTLYPLQNWQPIFSEISLLNDFDPEVRAFQRYFLSGATQIEMDNTGRLLLPKNLAEYASIDKDILVTSRIRKIEIWNSANYHQALDSITPDRFSSLAKEVMEKADKKMNS